MIKLTKGNERRQEVEVETTNFVRDARVKGSHAEMNDATIDRGCRALAHGVVMTFAWISGTRRPS